MKTSKNDEKFSPRKKKKKKKTSPTKEKKNKPFPTKIVLVCFKSNQVNFQLKGADDEQ